MDTDLPLHTDFDDSNGKNPFNAMNSITTTEDTRSSSSTTDNWASHRAGRVESRGIGGSNDLVGSDLTAAQLYESIEDNFME